MNEIKLMNYPEETLVKKTVVPAQGEGYFSDIFIEPPPKEAPDIGTIYVVAEIKSPAQDPPYIFNTICKLVKSGYLRRVDEKIVPDFEEALTNLNIFLTNLKKEGEIELVSHLNVAVVAIRKNTLQLSTVGNVTAIIKQQNETTKLLPVSDASLSSSDKFEHVITGKFNRGNILFVTTPGLFKIFHEENIVRTITQSESVPTDKIERIVASNKALLENEGVTCLVIEYDTKHREKAEARMPSLSRIPSPDFLLRFIKRMSSFTPGDLLSLPIPRIRLFLNQILLRDSRFLTRGTWRFKKLALPKIPNLTRLAQFTVRENHTGFHLAKIRLAAILVLFFLLTILVSGMIVLQEKHNSGDQNVITRTIEDVKKKQKEAENFLIFDDKNLAKKALLEAKTLLAQVAIENRTPEIVRYEEEIAKSIDTIQGIVDIESPTLVLDLTNLSLSFNPDEVFDTGQDLYLVSKKEQLLYRLAHDTDERTIVILNPGNDDSKPSIAAQFLENSLIILNQNQKRITQYGSRGEVVGSIKITTPENGFSFDDLAAYQNSIYALDPKSGSIFRYRIESLETRGPSPWIQNHSGLQKARDLAIDGSIYVLGSTGQILTYAQGAYKHTWEADKTFVSETANSIFTFEDAQFIYVLDPKAKKFVLLSRDGKLEKQYRSEVFNNLIDVAVTPDERKAYILNGKKVFRIDLK